MRIWAQLYLIMTPTSRSSGARIGQLSLGGELITALALMKD
jgi:hypothetical protein